MKNSGTRLEKKPSGSTAKKRKKSPLRVLFIVLGVIAGLCLTGFAAWRLGVTPPSINPDSNPDFNDNPVAPTPGSDNAQASSTPDSETSSALKLRDGVYTVLLVGTFEDGNTDTIMSVTFDTKEKTVDVMSIPRDTTTLWNGSQCKINSIYGRGGGGEDGMKALTREVGSLLGFVPNNYAMIKMAGFKQLVDTIGGVDFYVPMRMYHYDGKNTIDLQKGQQVLNGDKALQLMRFRGYGAKNPAGVDHDDFGRIQMQQQFLLTTFKQMVSLNNLTKVLDYVKIAAEMISPTDLELNNMLWFAEKLLGVSSENINFHTLPTKTSGQGWYENVDADAALALINETVNPFKKDITPNRCEWPQHK